MKLTSNKIKQLSEEEIYSLLLQNIRKIYKYFKDFNIKEERLKEIAISEIKKSKEEYNDDLEYSDYIEAKINKEIIEEIQTILYDDEKALEILDNYFNTIFKTTKDDVEAIKYFNKINSFFQKYSYYPTPDLLVNLINKNRYFSNSIEIIFNKYKKLITTGMIENVTDNDTLILIIETYCMVNNIKITENDKVKDLDLDLELISSTSAYLKSIIKYPILTVEEEKELAKEIAKGNIEAKNIFIERNLRLVINIAKKYINRNMEFLDLIQEGNIGLMKAVDKYDVEKGFKFSTYATNWIRQSITRAICDKSRNIRIPVHMNDRLYQYKKALDTLTKDLNRKPTTEEIAKYMNIPISKVEEIKKLQIDTLSINTVISDDDETELGDFIPSQKHNTENSAIDDLLKENVNKLLNDCNLKEREKEVLMLRYGFYNNNPLTLEEIGNNLNITRERVRQIESVALVKLRRSRYIKDFADFMDSPNEALDNIKEFREIYSDHSNRFKAYKKGKDDKEKENTKMARKAKNLYEYFNNYTKEQINEMLEKLSTEERELITIRYGEDLNGPVVNQLTPQQHDKFYNSLVPKMKRLLNTSKKGSEEEIKPKKSRRKKKNTEEVELKPTKDNKVAINKEDCIKMLELLKTPTFTQMMNILSPKEAIIISLKLGYVDGKYFSSKSIAEFLEIEEEEVNETVKKILLLYKENIDIFLDKVIEIATDESDDAKLLYLKPSFNNKETQD